VRATSRARQINSASPGVRSVVKAIPGPAERVQPCPLGGNQFVAKAIWADFPAASFSSALNASRVSSDFHCFFPCVVHTSN